MAAQRLGDKKVRTVMGDIDPRELGKTDVHEHLLMRSPLLRGEELDDREKSTQEAVELRQTGIDALVELTTIGLGRDPRGVAGIAAHSGLHIVLATGVHREAHYPPEHWVHRTAPEELAELFIRDITEGCETTDYSGPREQTTRIRAGVIKVGAGYWSISPLERRVFEAAGEAHRGTDAPVACHLEFGTAAWEVLEALEAAGVAPERIMLAHVDRNPDPGLHAELAAAGAYLGYDGMARFKYWPDSVLLDCLLRVASQGGADRLLLGGDVARRTSFRSYGGLPGMAYLPRRFVPRLAEMGGVDLVRRILIDNPARFLGFTPPGGG
ncbi:MAG: aryldialkylphosphatase [Actinomycetota bacterium]|nr:aryldialkylphosphatase [Actinomycetota bacterium]